MPVVPLQCPLCAGLIQIDTALAGQTAICPLCEGVIGLPPAEALAAAFSPPAGDASAGPLPPADDLPPQSDRLPPSSKPATPRPPPEPLFRRPTEDRLPPAAKLQAVEQPAERPVEQNDAIESLLPPGAGVVGPPPAVTEPAPARPKKLIDSLLPPGAASASAAAAPGEQVPIPAAPRRGPLTPIQLPAGTAAVPTPDGGFVTIKDTPKTIVHGDEEIEVRRLTPAEKAQRRFRRNLILGGICLAILLAVVVAFVW
jgi:hypothetical protein